MGLRDMPFQLLPVSQGVPEGFTNPTEPQEGVPLYQLGDFGPMLGLPLNPPLPSKASELQGGYADHSDGKAVLAAPPPLAPHIHHHNSLLI